MSQRSESPSASATVARPDVYATDLNARAFVIGSAAGLVAAVAILAGVVALMNQPAWWGGFAVSAVAGFAGAAISVGVVASLFRQPLQTLMGGFLVAGALRAVLIGAVIVIAVRYAGYSDTAVLACSGWLYAAAVAIEGFLLWNMTSRRGSIRVASAVDGSSLTPTQDNAR